MDLETPPRYNNEMCNHVIDWSSDRTIERVSSHWLPKRVQDVSYRLADVLIDLIKSSG